jgi:MoxR-like ATPase
MDHVPSFEPVDNPADIPPNQVLFLPASQGMAAAVHHFDPASVDALCAAHATGRALLVSGEPGVGKSQLARAAAVALGRGFISIMVEPRIEPQDLRYRFDAVGRLADAQLDQIKLPALSIQDDQGRVLDPLDPVRYLEPGPIWWAFAPDGAKRQAGRLRRQCGFSQEWLNPRGVVLLIDEIDKADADIPNSLLDALGHRRFHAPWLDQEVVLDETRPEPLVVITTNEERELPTAFERRCLSLHMRLPDDAENWLVACARQHLACWRKYAKPNVPLPDCPDAFLRDAAGLLLRQRKKAEELGLRPPSTAEYLDLVRAVLFHPAFSVDAAYSLLQRLEKITLHKGRMRAG